MARKSWYGLLINGHLKRIGRFDESPHIADFGVKARCAVQYEVREVKKMSLTNQDMVREFHETFDVPMAENPSLPSPEVAKLRMDLIAEEFRELQAGFASGDIVEIADALTDLLYVTYGAGLVCGIDLDACFSEVHRSNQAKAGPNGEVRRREDGKILKPEGWTAPNLAAVLGVSL